MATEWEILFNVARGKGADRYWPPVAMAQIQPHPKGLDGTKSVRASRGIASRCPRLVLDVHAFVGKSLVKPELPYIVTDNVMFLG